MRSLNVRLYLIGLTASLVGGTAMQLVSGICVKSLTGSDQLAGLAVPVLSTLLRQPSSPKW